MKKLRAMSGISFESLRRDLENQPREKAAKVAEQPTQRTDNADAIKLASRFIVSSFLFGADYVKDVDISEIEFADPVHEIIARYVRSKKLMEEDIHLSELFEFFDENTPEYEELSYILDYSEGAGFSGEVSRKYFSDCLIKLREHALDLKIKEESKKLEQCADLADRARIGETIVELTRQKQKIKNGVK